MTETDPTLKARLKRSLAQVLPEPTRLSIADCYLVGPFENYDLAGLFIAYPPEAVSGAAVNPTEHYQGKNGMVGWQKAGDLDGAQVEAVMLKDMMNIPPHSTVYLHFQVTLRWLTAATMSFQCSGLVHLWINGVLSISPAIPASANPEDASIWVTLQPGTNHLLVKMMFEGSTDPIINVRVQSYGPVFETLNRLRKLVAGPVEPGIRLMAKVILAELHGSAKDVPATLAALKDIREDDYATHWDVAWVEAVEKQFQSTGLFSPFHDPVMAYQPATSVQPYPEYWPQSSPTAKELLVVDASGCEPQVEFALSVLQGLVNRQQPRLYLCHTRYAIQDRMWLDELHEEGYRSREISIDEAWILFRKEVKGALLYDGAIMQEIGAFHSDQLNQTNVLMMIGALEDAVPMTPEMNQTLGLPVIFDARAKWTDPYDMMRWAYINLFPKMNQRLLATNYPGIFLITDYLVQFKIFTFWFPEFRTVIEENLLRGILASTPPNTPILGWWFDWMPNPKDEKHLHADAVMETPGVLLGSYFGKFLTPSHEATNLSVHSGVPLAGYQHKKPFFPEYDPSKVYYTFMISDGDNMGEALMMRTRDIQWDKPERGEFPMGWSFAPATSHLAPPVLNYYLRTSSSNDILMGGLGVAYTEPRIYLRAFPEQFETLWQVYAEATDKALGWIDSSVLWLINGRHEEADRYARGAGSHLRGIFIGYGGAPEIAEARITHNQVVAFYSATRTHWEDNRPTDERIQAMVDEIRAGVRQRPDFIEAWVLNWGLDMRMLLEVQKRLGPDYVCVRPDVLAQLRLLAQ